MLLTILGLLALTNTVLCEKNIVRLYNTNDFINFANSVNSGTNYRSTTIFLENHINFVDYQGELRPIGTDDDHAFAGTFDGQGYAIGNMKINVTEGYAGLFGYTEGATIKNLVFSTTNVINLFGISNAHSTEEERIYAGSIVGYCEKVGGYCRIESCINIGYVTFSGETNKRVCLGGIAGYMYSRYESHIRNCANYGVLTNSGKSKSIDMGGIIGHYGGISSNAPTISNCLNLGTILFDSSNVESWYVGGIVGHSEYCAVDNCVSGNGITTTEIKTDAIGMLAGSSSYTLFKNCYWNEAAGSLASGTEISECASYDSSFKLSKTVKAGSYVGEKLLDALNTAVDYYVLYEYAHWGYSIGKVGIDFLVNGMTKHFNLDSQLLLLPGFSSDGSMTFDGWYSDKDFKELLTDFTFSSDLKVYGKWGENTKSYTISFDTRGGTPGILPIVGSYNEEIRLPSDIEKGKCSLSWWENDYGDQVGWSYVIPAHDVTLHAVWGCEEISSASDLIGMMKTFNYGSSYSTVNLKLMNDIEFTDEDSYHFLPIGKSNNYFEGTLDGQGYGIKNLKLKTTSSRYGGIIGYSKGATIRNVVMDSTCSITSYYGSSNDEDIYFGGIVGYCEALDSGCTIENSVNMGTVIFEGNTKQDIYLGGIAGYLISTQSFVSRVINCANYGTIKHAGKTATFSDVGGLIGGWDGDVNGAYVFNSANYGLLSLVGESRVPSPGGIVGYDIKNGFYENCLSLGKIVSIQPTNCSGGIVGEIYTDSTIRNCYWDKNVAEKPVGAIDTTATIEESSYFDTEKFELSSSSSVGDYKGKSLINALNKYVETNSSMNYSKWVLNKNAKNVTFKIADRDSPYLILSSPVMLVPILSSSEDMVFSGWFKNSKCSKRFDLTEVTKDTTLYGKFKGNDKGGNKSKGSSTIVAVFVSLLVVTIVAAALIIGFIFLWSKSQIKPKSKRERHELAEPMLSENAETSFGSLNLYPDGYRKVTLKEALSNAGADEAKANFLSNICYEHANNLMEQNKLPAGVTVDDAAVIALYTMETEHVEQNPYRIINEALMEGSYDALSRVKDLLYLVMHALRKMPVVRSTLYRGIRSSITIGEIIDNNDDSSGDEDDDGHSSNREKLNIRKSRIPYNRNIFCRGGESFDEAYLEGEKVVWSALSSASSNAAATRRFLARHSRSGKAEGTLFVVENGWGYDVHSCSMFPEDEEVVLEPERHFKVKSVVPGGGLNVVKMEMIKTPVVLPNVFGESRGDASTMNIKRHVNQETWLQRR